MNVGSNICCNTCTHATKWICISSSAILALVSDCGVSRIEVYMRRVEKHTKTLWGVFFHFLDAFHHQKSYDLDMLGFNVFHHASLIDFNTADTPVWNRCKSKWRNDPSFIGSLGVTSCLVRFALCSLTWLLSTSVRNRLLAYMWNHKHIPECLQSAPAAASCLERNPRWFYNKPSGASFWPMTVNIQ